MRQILLALAPVAVSASATGFVLWLIADYIITLINAIPALISGT